MANGVIHRSTTRDIEVPRPSAKALRRFWLGLKLAALGGLFVLGLLASAALAHHRAEQHAKAQHQPSHCEKE